MSVVIYVLFVRFATDIYLQQMDSKVNEVCKITKKN